MPLTQKLCDFARNGGTVVVTYWTGVVDESDLCRLGDTPYGLTDLLGLRRTEIDGMYDGETCRCTPMDDSTLPETQASVLCEVASLNDTDPATPLSVYAEDYYANCPGGGCPLLRGGPCLLSGKSVRGSVLSRIFIVLL